MSYFIYNQKEDHMMSDELLECKSSFTGRKGELDVKVFLENTEGKTILVLELMNQAKIQFFQLKVDRNYLSENPEMSFCFQTPQDLFYTLMELFNQVKISEEGILTFQMKLNASKLKKKAFRIQIEQQKMDQNEMIRVKYQSLKRQLKNDLSARDEKIQILTKKNNQLQNNVQLLKEEVNEIKKQGEELSLQYKKKDFKINNIIKESDLQRQQISLLRKTLEEFHKKFSILQFYNFFDNPHWHYFSVYRGQQSVIIIKKDIDSIWHSFIRNVPLTEGKTYQFKIKQLKTNYRNIMIGIVARQNFGLANAYKSRSCISYNSYSGNVWEKGISRKGGMIVSDGQTVTIDINLVNYKLMWFIEGKKASEASIHQQFKNKQIFLCLQFYNIEDEIELLLY